MEDHTAHSVALMAKIGSCRAPSFSPDGTRLAFISNLSGIPQIWIVDATGGWPEKITALDDPVDGLAWAPTGEWLALSVAPGGGMNRQVYLVRPDGSGMRRLTDGGKENNWLGGWTHDGTALTIGSNRRNGRSIESYLYDMEKGEFQLVAPASGIAPLTDISRDRTMALQMHVPNRGDSDLYLLHVGSGARVRLTPHDGPGHFSSGKFSADGKTIYLIANQGRDTTAFASIRLGSGVPGPITVVAARDDAELQEYALTKDGAVAALLWNIAGRNELTFVDLASGRLEAAPPLPGEIASSLAFSPDGRRLAMVVMGSTAPADIWILERQTGRYARVTRSPHAGIDLEELVRPELVRFPAHDGLELTAWLYRPRGTSGPGPLVMSFHGGPEGQERPIFNSTYQALLAQGIGVLAPNVRGSAGFGKRFVNLDNGALRFDAIRDIKACYDAAVASGVADAGRVGIMGGSYGGYMVMAGLVEYPNLLAAGANLYGIVNFETFFKHTEPWMAAVSKIEYGDPDTEVELLRALSPIHRLDRIKAPTLVLHGANDTNVPVIEAEQVVENLKGRGVPVEYVLFPDEGHGFVKEPNRIRATTALVDWFVQHL